MRSSTSNVELVRAEVDLIDAELQDTARLADCLRVALPPDWPPEHHDEAVLRFTRGQLAKGPQQAGWWLHYIVLHQVDNSILVGTCGYKGPPHQGQVEVGYSVVPSWQRKGIATAAVRALIEHGSARGVTSVVADTLPHLQPSMGVLNKLGFDSDEPPGAGILRFRMDIGGAAS